MKITCSIFLTFLISACGDGSNQVIPDQLEVDSSSQKAPTTGTNNDSKSKSSKFSVTVNNLSELPTCDENRESALAYTKEDKTFRSCENGEWVTLFIKQESDIVKIDDEDVGENCAAGGKVIKTGHDSDEDGQLDPNEIETEDFVCNGVAGINGKDGINGINGINGIDGQDGQDGAKGLDGQDGTNGLAIDSISSLASSTEDFCTYFSNEYCYFKGGQIVRYSDGTVMIQANWSYAYVISGDTNTDDSSVTFIIPNHWNGALIQVSNLVARGVASYRDAYIVYDSVNNKAQLRVDSDNDGIIESTDELLISNIAITKISE